MKDKFIFTEAYNCGRILNKCLLSFFEFHDLELNIYGTPKDFKALNKSIMKNKNLNLIDVSTDPKVEELFKNGHLGTAYLFMKAIKESTCDHVVHFDSDLIFREEAFNEMFELLDNGYDIVGPRRPYKNNICNRKDLGHLADVSHTYLYGFNKAKISNFTDEVLHQMIVGYFNPLNHPILDFFDPVCFDILKNGGKIHFLDFDKYGSSDESGNRKNKYGEINEIMDFGDKLIHFAGVGSGYNFYNFGNKNVVESYTEWAKARYSLYEKLVYGKEIDFSYDEEHYNKLKKYFKE